MSKTSDMATTIEELRNAVAAINDVANWLAKAFSSADDTATVPATKAPAAEPALKLEDVRAVLAEKSRAGHTAEIRSLLQKYGADKLSKIDPANYKALFAEAEVLDNAT